MYLVFLFESHTQKEGAVRQEIESEAIPSVHLSWGRPQFISGWQLAPVACSEILLSDTDGKREVAGLPPNATFDW